MSSFGENYKKNNLLDDIQHFFSEGGTIEEMFDVLRYIFEYGKTPLDDLIQENQKYKEVFDKIRNHCEIEINASNHYLKNHKSQKELCHKVAHQRILEILKEVK